MCMDFKVIVSQYRVGKPLQAVHKETKPTGKGALSYAETLARRRSNRPACHQNIGFNMITVHGPDGVLIGGYKVWRDGMVKSIK